MRTSLTPVRLAFPAKYINLLFDRIAMRQIPIAVMVVMRLRIKATGLSMARMLWRLWRAYLEASVGDVGLSSLV